MNTGFSVHWRNPGHWDVCDDKGRAFRIRGEGDDVYVLDERPAEPPWPPAMHFPSVAAAILWIADTMMRKIEQDRAELYQRALDATGR